MSRWRHFQREEFACKCGCGQNGTKDEFIDKLDKARHYARVPFPINSGFRCKEYDRLFGGKANHTGWAADISATTSRNRFWIVVGLVLAGFRRFGIAETFVHCDITPGKPKWVLWLYANNEETKADQSDE